MPSCFDVRLCESGGVYKLDLPRKIIIFVVTPVWKSRRDMPAPRGERANEGRWRRDQMNRVGCRHTDLPPLAQVEICPKSRNHRNCHRPVAVHCSAAQRCSPPKSHPSLPALFRTPLDNPSPPKTPTKWPPSRRASPPRLPRTSTRSSSSSSSPARCVDAGSVGAVWK